MVKVHVVDLKTETLAPPVNVRAYLNQTVAEFKQIISQVRAVSRLVLKFVLLFVLDLQSPTTHCCHARLNVNLQAMFAQGTKQRICFYMISSILMCFKCDPALSVNNEYIDHTRV